MRPGRDRWENAGDPSLIGCVGHPDPISRSRGRSRVERNPWEKGRRRGPCGRVGCPWGLGTRFLIASADGISHGIIRMLDFPDERVPLQERRAEIRGRPTEVVVSTERIQASYGAEDITVLEGLDPVRKRPGMYIGSTGPRGLHHLVYEVVDNSIDEALAGYCSKILVQLLPDGGCRVVDNGRGIPVGAIPGRKDRKPAVEVVLTTLHAGGKFGGKSYAVAGGLHGVGVSVVNALSQRLVVEVARDGSVWRQEFERGRPTTKLRKGKPTNRTGTVVTFWPDPEVFT